LWFIQSATVFFTFYFTRTALIDYTISYKNPTKLVGLVQSGPHHHLIGIKQQSLTHYQALPKRLVRYLYQTMFIRNILKKTNIFYSNCSNLNDKKLKL
jgi:hypothetical protein